MGGGCGGITAAFELTRPEHRGKYAVTVYQLGWRIGGKGASGRGPANRIEEHGLHIWMGAYENAFRLLRECYAELDRPANHRFATWQDAFYPDPYVAVADKNARGEWLSWVAKFPNMPGLPGDPLDATNPFTMAGYMSRTVTLIKTLLLAIQERQVDGGERPSYWFGAGQSGENDLERRPGDPTLAQLFGNLQKLLRLGQLTTLAATLEALYWVEMAFQYAPALQPELLRKYLAILASNLRTQLALLIDEDDEIRRLWEIIDLTLAIMRGVLKHGLMTDPRGLDAINDYECRDWLRDNGASEASLDSAIMQGLYDLAFAYEDGDFDRPCLAAGQAIRGALRMFFTYRGSLFWKMNAGMGDVVFAPFYEVLKARGVKFEFFHRLENVQLATSEQLANGETPHVTGLEFDIQATTLDSAEYQPLVDCDGVPCWPAQPDFTQLEDGERMRADGRDFESFWDRRAVGTRRLKVGADFDAVVLAVGLGAIPHVAPELVARDPRWRDMVDKVKTVATQAFQLWLNRDLEALGWNDVPVNLSGYVQPFDTWADMRQLIPQENWGPELRSIAYFCSALPTAAQDVPRDQTRYPAEMHEQVRKSAIHFLNKHMGVLWPNAVAEANATHDPLTQDQPVQDQPTQDAPGSQFHWEFLLDAENPAERPTTATEARFSTQFWTANVNPSDRYVLCPPGSPQYRISPLDGTYDNLTVAGDWTGCGFTEGCVEAAVMSGRLAAHAISQWPPLEEIVGFDHP